MTTVFEKTMRPILILSKFFGLIQFSYKFNSTGLLVRDANTDYSFIFELIRMFVMIIFTHQINQELTYIRIIILIKFWVIFLASRLSEIWIIKLINGIILFDRKLTFITTSLLRQRSPSKKKLYFNIVFSFLYCVLFRLFYTYPWNQWRKKLSFFAINTMGSPFIADYMVVITTIFYLSNLECRFKLLNDLWECLMPRSATVHDRLTQSERIMLIEKIRLLHFELSELIGMFSLGNGKLLLGFFSILFIDVQVNYYNIICFDDSLSKIFANNSNRHLNSMPYIIFIQNIIFLVYIIIAASRVTAERTKIITNLRSMHLSCINKCLKSQVKIFMNQLSLIDRVEITAYGYFDINLHLIVSIIELSATGLITFIQMKKHPIILQFTNYNHDSILNLIYKNSTINQ